MEFSPESTRRATRVGGVVLALAVAWLMALLTAAGVQWQSMRSWSVVGTFQEGLRGIRPGSVVRVGGVVMGQVTDVELDPRAPHRPPERSTDEQPPEVGRLLVTFDLDASIELRAGARIVYDVNPISGIGELDIVNVGWTQAAALPGRVGRSAMLAPVQPTGRPFTLSVRRPAIETILGAANAREWARISATIEALDRMFLPPPSATDPTTGEAWGPNAPGAASALVQSLQDLRDTVSGDLVAWGGEVDGIRAQLGLLRSRIGAETADAGGEPTLIEQFRRLNDDFNAEHGLRGLGRELQPLFDSFFSTHGKNLDRAHDVATQWRLIGAAARALWPQMIDDLQVSRAGFVIGASELWLASGPEFWTTLIRLFQPMSAKELEALNLILATNRVALSAGELREAIEMAQAVDGATGAAGAAVSPRVREALLRNVADAIRRYRRDLSDMLRALERTAEAR